MDPKSIDSYEKQNYIFRNGVSPEVYMVNLVCKFMPGLLSGNRHTRCFELGTPISKKIQNSYISRNGVIPEVYVVNQV